MKTTLEIPDALFRKAKAKAAEQGIPLREFVTVAVEAKLEASPVPASKPWMKGFGKRKHLHAETLKIDRIIEAEFEQLEPEDFL